MSRPIDVFLDRLANYKLRENGRDRWRACCPAHGGSNPSALSVGIGVDDAVLIRCWSGCDVDEVAGALGLDLSSLFPSRLIDHGTGPLVRRALLSARQALDILENETTLVWTAAANMANGYALTSDDRERLNIASARIHAACDEVRA